MRLGFAAAVRGSSKGKRGELWRLRGHVLRSLRRTRDAAGAYRRADRWFQRAGDPRERGRCAIGLVDALMYLGRYREAFAAASRGRRLLARAGDATALARLCNNEGNLFHRMDAPERALERYHDARRILARAGDARGAAMVAGNVANCLALLGRCAEARRLYGEVKRANAAAGFELDALNADYNLAYLGFLEHRHESALEDLARIGSVAGDRGYPSLVALTALDRAEILLRLGSHEQALTEARRAEERCAALGLAYERAKAETFAALAEYRLGLSASARARLERALEVFHAQDNETWMGEGLVGLATVWWREGNPRAAAALLAAARRRFVRVHDRERERCCLALLARARLEYGDRGGARGCLDDLRRATSRLGSPRLRHLALAAEAAMALASQDRRRARALLRRAATESERLAARILDEQWRASFWGEWGWPHLELAALELKEGRVGEALEALERGRGRGLTGISARVRGSDDGALPTSVWRWAAMRMSRDRERVARSRAAAVAEAPAAEKPVPSGSLKRTLESFPALTIRAESLRRSLPDGRLLVDYLVHDGALGAIGVRRAGLNGYPQLVRAQPLGELVHALLFELRGAAFKPARERSPDAALHERLAEIAALVLWPMLEAAGPEPPRSLAIVPAGPLTRLPWAALPLPDGRALCQAMEVVVLPGLRLGMISAAGAKPRGRTNGAALVVASDAGELESVEPETRALIDCFPDSLLLTAAAATAARFMELAPAASWIHFAGHGLYRADAPHESALRLADRWLSAAEIADLRLSSSWVTLSACQTARALVRPGEEWFGLARSFLLSGAKTVLASQWDIEDHAAARLMTGTYRRLAAGEPFAAALARAQAACLAEGAHPLDWAGFVVLGGPDSGSAVAAAPRNSAERAARL